MLIGSVLVSTYVVVLCLEKAGAFQGYEFDQDYSTSVRDYLSKKVLSLSAAEIAKYLFTAKDSSGSDYVALSSDGYDWSQDDVWPDATKNPIYQMEHQLSNTTSNTSTSSSDPYMDDGFYTVPYLFKSAGSVLISPFLVKKGDTINFHLRCYDGNVSNASFTPVDDCYIRLIQLKNPYNTVNFQYSYDNSYYTIVPDAYCYTDENHHTGAGYNTTTNTVYVPASDVITNTGSTTAIGSDQVVAVPISGQYSTDGTTKIYDGIDGGVANAVSGLKASDLANTGSNTGEGTQTGANTLTQEAVRDAVRDGIGDSTVGDLDIPNDVPRLDFTPLEVATKKFPFCVPFDFANLFGQLNSPAQCPVVSVPSTTVGSTVGMPVTIPEIDFDLSTLPNIDNILNITKFFEYIGFLAFLILKTRNLIRG
ncbi:putative heme/steroid binding protein [Clostridium beijerinckii]|nr:putative heme/steroid binding protein [Clostridium beijerinckii]